MAQAQTLTRTRRIRRADRAKYLRRRILLVAAGSALMFGLGSGLGLAAGLFFPYPRVAALALARRGSIAGPENILVAGIDVNYDRHGHPIGAARARTDFLMLVHVGPEQHSLTLISIPRDTQVLVPGYGTAKINAAHALGGMPATVRVVEALLGIHVDHFAQVDLSAAVELLDQLAPIHIYVVSPLHYVDRTAKLDIQFAPGWHDMSGQELVNYARFRHDALGDIGRISRQQLVLHALEERMRAPSVWFHLPHMLAIAPHLVQTDMGPGELAALAAIARSSGATRFLTLPGEFGYHGYWIPDISRISRMLASLQDQTLSPRTPKVPGTVEVLYQPAREHDAALLASELSDRGLEVIRSAPLAAEDTAATRIIERTADSPWERPLRRLLPRAPWQVSDELTAYSSDYTIIVGPDYPL